MHQHTNGREGFSSLHLPQTCWHFSHAQLNILRTPDKLSKSLKKKLGSAILVDFFPALTAILGNPIQVAESNLDN